jgi:hypothetical protein
MVGHERVLLPYGASVHIVIEPMVFSQLAKRGAFSAPECASDLLLATRPRRKIIVLLPPETGFIPLYLAEIRLR